jgi:membrane protease YdiL (CAAX protease family)
MEIQNFWNAKPAFILYILLISGILIGSVLFAIILLSFGIDIYNSRFPSAIISLPINEGIIFAITIFFAKQYNANFKKLGLKKPKIKTILVASLVAGLLFLLAIAISLIEGIILGPDPEAEFLIALVLPKNSLQLIVMIAISIFLVGPAEELAFRGFIQRGFETSYGKNSSLLLTSIMFGLLHGFNSLRSIVPVTIVSVILGYFWQKTNGNTTAVALTHGLYDSLTITLAYLINF